MQKKLKEATGNQSKQQRHMCRCSQASSTRTYFILKNIFLHMNHDKSRSTDIATYSLTSEKQMKSHTFDIKRNLFLCPHQKIFHSPDSIGFPEILMYMWTAQQTQMETHSFFFRLLMMVVFKITRAMKRRLTLNPQYFRRRTETQETAIKIKQGGKSYKPKLACVMIMLKANTRL